MRKWLGFLLGFLIVFIAPSAQAQIVSQIPWQAGYGGTGFSIYTIGDTLYADTASSLAKLASPATGQVITSGGVGVAPAWSASPTLSGTVTALSLILNKVASTGTVTPSMTVTEAAHTALTASTERFDTQFNSARTVQWATGALALQRFNIFQAPTIGFVGGSTVTDTCTLCITGAPISGTNTTLTNTYSLLIQASAVSAAANTYGLAVLANTGGTNNFSAVFLNGNVGVGSSTPSATLHVVGNYLLTPTALSGAVPATFTLTAAAHTNVTASTEKFDTNFNSARTIQWATGALTTQRFNLFQAPTVGFVGGSTVTDTCTLCITGAPVSGTNATLTNTHGLLIQAGAVTAAGTAAGMTVNAPTGGTLNYAAVLNGGTIVTSTLANAFIVGPAGVTNPSFRVDANTGSAITGLLVTAAASGAGVNLKAIGSATEPTIIDTTGSANVKLNINGSTRYNVANTQIQTTPGNRGSGVLTQFVFTGDSATALTAGTEAKDFLIDLSQTKQHASNTTITLQRHAHVLPGTDTCASATCTITEDATFAIGGPTIGGTSSTVTQSEALLIETRAMTNVATAYGLVVNAPTGGTTFNYAANLAGPVLYGSVTFTNLGTPTNGTVTFCSDCDPPTVVDATCAHAAGQTGALAVRVNGAWKCFS